MALSELLEDRALLIAVCEDLVPFMNGAKMCRLTRVLDELRLDPSGSHLEEEDGPWLSEALTRARERQPWWASEIRKLEDEGIRIVASVDSDYPVNLTLVHDAPPLLFVRGKLSEADRRSVAVVGTRNATPEGLEIANTIAAGYAGHGFTVISGLARGIDTAAHSAAVDAGGRTIAVFGTPIEKVYPTQNKGLARQISKVGACVSQFFPNVRGGRWTFPARNLTCSGLSLATVVVEASETSGARLQAKAARYHGKRVFLMDPLVTSQVWAKQMVVDSSTVVAVSTYSEITEILQTDLDVSPDAVFA